MEITIAVPKGRLYKGIKEYLKKINIELPEETRQYYYKDYFAPGVNLFIAKPKSIPQLLESGLCQFGFCGRDIIENYDNFPVYMLANTWLNHVDMVFAVKANHDLSKLNRPIICATEYPVVAEKYLVRQLGKSVYILDTTGATEGYVHIGADCIIDVCETGKTIKANGLKIEKTIFQSATCLYGIPGIETPEVIKQIETYSTTSYI